MELLEKIEEIFDTESLSTCVDIFPQYPDYEGYYQALLASPPKNPKLLKVVKDLVKNAETRFYGNFLGITGPALVYKILGTNVTTKCAHRRGIVSS